MTTAQFNRKKQKRKQQAHSKDTVTYEGGPAYSYIDARQELVAAVATTFLDDKYYESGRERLTRIRKLIRQCVIDGHAKFVYQLAVTARQEWHLRSVTHLLLGELVFLPEGRVDLTRRALLKAWVRPDDMLQTFAYWYHRNGGKKARMPRVLRNAVQDRLLKLDMFQAAKYHGNEMEISLRDLLRMTHPDRKQVSDELRRAELGKVFDAILQNNIPTTSENWRSMQHKLINDGMPKAKVWEKVIPKMGYFAILNNLEAFRRDKVRKKVVLERLTNAEAIRRSRLLPFRFVTALEVVEDRDYQRALKDAMMVAFENLELPVGKRFLIAVDVSGSMMGNPVRKAAQFASILWWYAKYKHDNFVRVVLFATDLQEIVEAGEYSFKHPYDLYQEIMRRATGGATYGQLVYDFAAKQPKDARFDYIVFLTDMQYHNVVGHYTYYRKRAQKGNYEPPHDAFVINANLQGYDRTQTPFDSNKKILEVSNISEKLFDYLDIVLNKGSMVNSIENYSI